MQILFRKSFQKVQPLWRTERVLIHVPILHNGTAYIANHFGSPAATLIEAHINVTHLDSRHLHKSDRLLHLHLASGAPLWAVKPHTKSFPTRTWRHTISWFKHIHFTATLDLISWLIDDTKKHKCQLCDHLPTLLVLFKVSRFLGWANMNPALCSYAWNWSTPMIKRPVLNYMICANAPNPATKSSNLKSKRLKWHVSMLLIQLI